MPWVRTMRKGESVQVSGSEFELRGAWTCNGTLHAVAGINRLRALNGAIVTALENGAQIVVLSPADITIVRADGSVRNRLTPDMARS